MPARRAMLLFGVVVVLGCGGLELLGQGLAPTSQHSAAKSRWLAAAVSHYRLSVDAGSPCLLDVEVRDERVVRVLHEDNCTYPARTVPGLFNLVERAISPLYNCAPPSCACRNIVSVYALYDEQLGYPRKVAVRAVRETNWRAPAFWRYLWQQRRIPDCVWASNADIVTVHAVTPLR